MEISVVIPAYNEEENIGECLDALLDQTLEKERYEIIVVDNLSSDQTKEIAESYNVYVFSVDGNVGKVRNFGATRASGENLAFIDADCIAPPNWLEKGLSLLQNQKGTVFGGGYKSGEDFNWVAEAWMLGDGDKRLPKELLGGCIFSTQRDFWAAGGFDEDITSGEDTKLSLALREKGSGVVLTPEISVIHSGVPRNAWQFFKRQIWHSENYIKEIQTSIKDPMFYIIVANSALVLALPISLIYSSFLFKLNLIFLATLPLVLSVKRVKRSRLEKLTWLLSAKIYVLDILYLKGRMCGVIKGLLKRQ